MELKNLDLHVWNPDPWDATVDTVQPYFIWLFSYTYGVTSDDDPWGEFLSDCYLTVGSVNKGGGEVAGDSNVVVSDFHMDKHRAFAGTRPARPTDLEKAGLSPLEIIALLGAT